ncbi:MAG: hypothetical protein KGJ90_03815 [Patescibacteria group bacterium]|nr:hypothetical protein [Patescibacteria group bacterium]
MHNSYGAFYLAINPGYDPLWFQQDVLAPALEKVNTGELKRLAVFMPPRHGKQCANSVSVLTANRGWVTHGDLVVGDEVFSLLGKPTKILAVVEQPEPSNMEVEFANGTVIKVHPNHEWRVFDRGDGRWKVIETRNMLYSRRARFQGQIISLIHGSRGRRGAHCRFLVPHSMPLEFTAKELPIHPYALGVWLGDGKSSDASICWAVKDEVIVNAFTSLVGNPSWTTTHRTTGVKYAGFKQLNPVLKKLSLLNNKHIPDVYKYGSIEQRLQLLAGLIDTDGSVNQEDGRVHFVGANERLIEDVRELIRSFGWHPSITAVKPGLSTSGIQGKLVCYHIGFSPNCAIPTKIPRKRTENLKPVQRRIGIIDVRMASPEPGKCIQVASADGLYLVGKELIPTHNSSFISVGFPSWYLGHHPDYSIITLSYSDVLAAGFGRQVRDIMQGELYASLFPKSKLKADSRAKDAFNTVSGGRYTAAGLNGTYTGIGANLLIIDDPVSSGVSAASEADEANRRSIYTNTARTRLQAGASIILVMTRWPGDSFSGWLLEQFGFELYDPRRQE